MLQRVFGFLFFAFAVLVGGQAAAEPEKTDVIIVAGGCFWCVESDFDKVDGVLTTTSGYIGGKTENPTYKQVVSGNTGHLEAVAIRFNPAKVSYEELLDVFWRSVDPTDGGGQFCDRGESYSTGIFARNPQQKLAAEKSKRDIESSGVLDKPIATRIVVAGKFYPAEDYHQDYYEKNPLRYKFYRHNCGRDARVQAVWGDQAHRGIAMEKK